MGFITDLFSDIPGFLIRLIIVIFSLTIHEVAHGYAAYKMGDPTAKVFGRLSLNPLKHLDPLGFLCMLFFRFGWAKPVPINTRYFKKPRQGMAVSALAGPLANILMSFIGLIFYKTVLALQWYDVITVNSQFAENLFILVFEFFSTFCVLNLYLGVFNLIPVPPLDGSRILFVVLPDKLYFGIMKYEQYIQIALIVLLYLGLLSGPLSALCGAILNGMEWLLELIPFFKL